MVGFAAILFIAVGAGASMTVMRLSRWALMPASFVATTVRRYVPGAVHVSRGLVG